MGHKSVLSFIPASNATRGINVKIKAWTFGDPEIEVRYKERAIWVGRVEADKGIKFSLPMSAWQEKQPMEFEIICKNPISPNTINKSPDTRVLSLAIESIVFEESQQRYQIKQETKGSHEKNSSKEL